MVGAINETFKSCQRRLLEDIAEVQKDPYPNIHLHPHENDIRTGCLILVTNKFGPLHLTIRFPDQYPLKAPKVTIQSRIEHPNVYDSYICASILNTDEGWTPAYTLKGIVIQLLSFFSSDKVEQERGGSVDLTSWRYMNVQSRKDIYQCSTCGLGPSWAAPKAPKKVRRTGKVPQRQRQLTSKLYELPNEIVLELLEVMDTQTVVNFGEALPSIKNMLQSLDFIRLRELQCFCLKKSFTDAKLGIGVSVGNGSRPVIRSEFDLLSLEAFEQIQVRKSVQGVAFTHWLALPLSHRHWNKVRQHVHANLDVLHQDAHLGSAPKVNVLYNFMTNIVVQFSNVTERFHLRADGRSTLTHASEKAVEAYFALFHLLLCLATEDPSIVQGANNMVARFVGGQRNKAAFPDLGHLLAAALLSDAGLTEELTFQIIREAIVRNVVWMLDRKGAAMPELAYLEPARVSEYRLAKTFEASRTSYRLLMFLKLFSCTARTPGTTLAGLRDALFDTHGAPPPGTAAEMARRIRAIRAIDGFPGFLKAMGIPNTPTKEEFTRYLRRTIGDSVNAGYSVANYSQTELFRLRREKEPAVEPTKKVDLVRANYAHYKGRQMANFFPKEGKTKVRG